MRHSVFRPWSLVPLGSVCIPTLYFRVVADGPTSATDVLLVAYQALTDDEQDELHRRIRDARLDRIEATDSQTALFVKSLRRACEVLGHIPTAREYAQVRRDLAEQGEEIASQNSIIRFFGTWRLALEAFDLSETQTGLAIEARFRKRLLGRPAEYTEETLRESLAECVATLERIPTLTEFTAWRRRKTELAKAQGVDIWIPGDHAYRSRYGTWEQALLHFGYAPEEVAARLDPAMRSRLEKTAQYRYPAGSRWVVDQALENE